MKKLTTIVDYFIQEASFLTLTIWKKHISLRQETSFMKKQMTTNSALFYTQSFIPENDALEDGHTLG